MKLPDITLFFQMIHFLLAYWALRRFIFAPALIIIHEQDQKNQLLTDKVECARSDLKDTVEQRQNRWNFIRQSLIKMAPSANLQKCLLKFKVTAPVEVSRVKISTAEKDSIQKVLHDKLLDIS
ncbi:hypothetical protein HYV10_00880 [Candidatus Dependentiae bacterium]|nr:hypothetical protein [Candidatus Dependentiae bacterium]